ncbi:hypothetical protein FRC03_003447 [Tulasnella sp. 419]|nr:hypothetical protein FRC02_012456 [Tulasnella sp. 418]KAG8963082.1 hypothetical protein FRC03_003447 [Tulasnella sp. 419]
MSLLDSKSMLDTFSSIPHPSIALAHVSTRALEWLPVMFRSLALVVLAPIIILTMLDITAYLIARTLGHPHPKPLDPSSISTSHKPVDINTSKILDLSRDDVPSIHVTRTPTSAPMSIEVTSTSQSPEFPHHFTSPSEGVFALSGEGVFSPPISRAGSPSIERRRKRSQSNVTASGTSDGESDRSSSLGVGSQKRRDSSTSPESDHSFPTISPSKVLRHRKNPGFQFTPVN